MVCKLPLVEVDEFEPQSPRERAPASTALAVPADAPLVVRLPPGELARLSPARLSPPEQRLLSAHIARLERTGVPRDDELGAALAFVFTRRFRASLVRGRRGRVAAKRYL